MYLLAFHWLKNQRRFCRSRVGIAVSCWLKSSRDAFAGKAMTDACEGNGKSVLWRGQLASDRHCTWIMVSINLCKLNQITAWV